MDFKFYNDNLLKFRKEIKLSQEDLAEKLNVSRQTISAWESGKSKPSIENIINMSEVFNVSIDELSSYTNLISNKKTSSIKKKIFITVIITLSFIFLIYIFLSIRKGIIFVKINNNQTLLEDQINYYYKITKYTIINNKSSNLNKTEVFFKDNILNMLFYDQSSSNIIWIDYSNNYGYSLNKPSYKASNINLKNSLFPNENSLRNLSSFKFDNNNMINFIYGFNPFIKLKSNQKNHIISYKNKFDNYNTLIELHYDKKTCIPLYEVEHGSNGISYYILYDIKLNNTTELDVKLPNISEYEFIN